MNIFYICLYIYSCLFELFNLRKFGSASHALALKSSSLVSKACCQFCCQYSTLKNSQYPLSPPCDLFRPSRGFVPSFVYYPLNESLSKPNANCCQLK